MKTKIDISSLDEATKNEIERLQRRCEELYEGVTKKLTNDVEVMVIWTEGDESDIVDMGELDDGSVSENRVEKARKELKKKVDKEIKKITEFADKIADKLGVNKDEFFDQYFAA